MPTPVGVQERIEADINRFGLAFEGFEGRRDILHASEVDYGVFKSKRACRRLSLVAFCRVGGMRTCRSTNRIARPGAVKNPPSTPRRTRGQHGRPYPCQGGALGCAGKLERAPSPRAWSPPLDAEKASMHAFSQ
jgi:hypothetical protein